MNENEFYVHSRVYEDTFKNPPYSVSLFETTDVTTPDRRKSKSEFYDRATTLRQKRIRKEQETART